MSFAPAVCCSETLCHVVSRQVGVSVMALVLVVHTVVTKCPDISGPRHPLLFFLFFIYFPGRNLVTAKLNLNLKFISANQVSNLESGEFDEILSLAKIHSTPLWRGGMLRLRAVCTTP